MALRLFLPLALAALACGAVPAREEGVPPGPAAPDRPLKPLAGQVIVSYNVENLFDTLDDPRTNDDDFLPNGKLHWTGQRYRRKLEHLAKAIAWTGTELPPVVGLTEVENGAVLADLIRTKPLDQGGYQVVHFDSPDERGIDVALLVRAAYATVLVKEPLAVPLGNDRTRDVLYVELGLASGIRLHVFQDHWPSRREGAEKSEPKRMAAARVVRDQVDAILAKDPQAKVLIMGDFNDHPQDRSIREGLRAGCSDDATKDLVDLMCSSVPPTDADGSYLHDGRWGYLDQMIVSRGFRTGPGPTAASAKAFRDKRLLFRHPKFGLAPDKTYSRDDYKGGFSDHLPVVLEVR